ncbi:MAG TPA: hypothetical protein ENJ82_17745 [Bacteroidetes bacterium]|nr:hypothetical protein [Bacteroidota bacterium]
MELPGTEANYHAKSQTNGLVPSLTLIRPLIWKLNPIGQQKKTLNIPKDSFVGKLKNLILKYILEKEHTSKKVAMINCIK